MRVSNYETDGTGQLFGRYQPAIACVAVGGILLSEFVLCSRINLIESYLHSLFRFSQLANAIIWWGEASTGMKKKPYFDVKLFLGKHFDEDIVSIRVQSYIILAWVYYFINNGCLNCGSCGHVRDQEIIYMFLVQLLLISIAVLVKE